MAKQINIDLVFNANTSQAKSQMVSLQNQLTQLQSATTNNIGMSGFTKEVERSTSAVASLQANLTSAFNVSTGKLDLTKFNQNLKTSQMTLTDYRRVLSTLGAEGDKAFRQLTQSVIQGEMPLKRTKNLLTSMMDTFGSSIKWTIAYGAIDSVRQGFQDAFQYAQDLNESLTNIGVVAQKSTAEMAKFAETANKAAKALSSTTTQYTDAALIYYQQGLSDDEVQKRTDATIKMANVTGQSVQQTSEQLTAIWNNFDNGSKSLEHYADVMVKLGAETASSADEIAQGFEKFAAVADTVGLSYEKGAAAIATVTATTRQSADVVGTAFKTLFARIQDLELGNTLDDGTTLGSYSEALNKVGINIKTTSGDLKEMDVILAEMGSTWKTLSNDEQVALAKSVAGIRQYTQLIALMENYDYFEQLTDSAENATGTLDEQQERWAESWEASSNRVRSAAEGIYSNLINDEFFIDLNNIFADLLGHVDKFMDAIGGLSTILPFVAGWMMQAFGPTMISMIGSFTSNLKASNQALQIAEATESRKTALREMAFSAGQSGTMEGFADQAYAEQELKFMSEIEKSQRNFSKEQAETLRLKQEELNNLHEELVVRGQIADQAVRTEEAEKEEANSKRKDFANEFMNNNLFDAKVSSKNSEKWLGALADGRKIPRVLSNVENDITNTMMQQGVDEQYAKSLLPSDPEALKQQFTDPATGKWDANFAKEKINQMGLTETNLPEDIKTMALESDGSYDSIQKLANEIQKLDTISDTCGESVAKLTDIFKKYGLSQKEAEKAAEEFVNGIRESNSAAVEAGVSTKKASAGYEGLEHQMEETGEEAQDLAKKFSKKTFGETLIQSAGAIFMMAGGLSSLVSGMKSAVESIKNGTFGFEEFLSILTSITMGVSMTIGGLNSMKTALTGVSSAQTIFNALEQASLKSKQAIYSTTLGEIALKNTLIQTSTAEQLSKKLGISLEEAENVIKEKGNITKQVELVRQALGIGLQKQENAEKGKGILTSFASAGAKGAESVAQGILNGLIGIGIGLATAFNFLISPIGLIILAIVAAVTLLVVGIVHLTKAWNADAEAAKKAAENAKNVEEQYNKTKEAYDNLKKSLEDYNKAQEAINSLKEGTKEWRDAIQESNQQVLELLETYSELSNYISNEDGRLVISQEGQQKLLELEQSKVTTQYNAKLDASLAADQAKNKSTQTDLKRGELDTYNDVHAWGAGIIGAILTLGGLNVIGLPLLTETIAKNEEAGQEADNAINELQKAYNQFAEENNGFGEGFFENWDAQVDKIAGSNTELAQRLKENKDEMKALIESNKALKDREDYNDQIKADQYLSDKGFLNYDNYGSNAQKLVREKYQQTRNDLREYDYNGKKLDISNTNNFHYQKWYSLGLATGGTEAGKDVAQAYADLMGYQDFDVTNFKGDKIQFKYKKAGEEQYTENQEVTYEQMQKTLAEHAITQQDIIIEYANKVTRTIGQLKVTAEYADTTSEKAAGALAGFANDGTFDFVDPEQMQAFQELGAENTLAQLGYDAQEFAKTMGYVEADGTASVQKMLNAIDEAMLNYNPEKALANIQQRISEEIDTIFTAAAENLETTTNALDLYAAHLIETNEGLEENQILAAEAAVEHFRLAKGLNKLQKAFQDNAEILQEANKNSLEYYEALGEVKEAVEETFGLEVSADFVADNLEKIQAMANGSEEALDELRLAVSKDFIINLNLGENTENIVLNEISRLSDLAKSLPIDTPLTINSTDAINALSESLATGKATVDEMEAMFRNANLEMPALGYKMAPGPKTETHNVTKYKLFGKEHSFETTTYSTTQTEVPFFEGAEPNFDTSGNVTGFTNTGNVQLKGLGDINQNEVLDYGETETTSDKKKRLKDLDNEIERYHEIDEVIENTERELDKLAKAKDRAFGKNKLALMDQEIAKNKELLEQQKQRAKEAKEYYEKDRKQLLSNYAVELDADGNIANYNNIIENITSKMKGMNLEGTDYEKMEESLESFKEDAKNYEDSLDQLAEAEQTFLDLQYELQDLALEKITYEVEFKVETEEENLKYIEFLMQTIEDDAFKAAEKIKLQGDTVESVLNQIAATEDGIAKIIAEVETTGIMTDDQRQKLIGLKDNLIDYNATLLETKELVEESLTEAYDAWNEKIEENISKFDHYGSIIEHYQNIVDIVGKDNLGISDDTLMRMWNTQSKNAAAAMKANKENLEAQEQVLEDYKNQAKNAPEEDAEYWEDMINKQEQNVRDAAEAFNESWENSLQTIADNFGKHIELIAESFDKSMSGIYNTLDELNEAFDQQKEIGERFLEDYEKTYEISKLNRQIEQSIDKTDNVANQKQLRNLQAQLLELSKEGNKVSQYDIEYMQKKYDLLLAEQALRDAQNAKSVVRLQRDSEGNYNYTYTTDQTVVDSAQQTYEDKLYELQQWSEGSLWEIQETLLGVQTEFKEALLEISQDESLSLEEREEKIAKTTEYYANKMRDWTDIAISLTKDNADANAQFNLEMAENFYDTTLGSMYPNLTKWEDLYELSHENMQKYTLNLQGAIDQFEQELEEDFRDAGNDVKKFDDKVNTELESVDENIGHTSGEATKLKDNFTEQMGLAATAVGDFQDAYGKKMLGIRNETDLTIERVKALITQYQLLDNAKKGKFETEPEVVKTPIKPTTNTGGAYGTLYEKFKDIPTGKDINSKYQIGDLITSIGNAIKYTNNKDGTFSAASEKDLLGYSFNDVSILDVAQGYDGNVYYKINNAGSEYWVGEGEVKDQKAEDKKYYEDITKELKGRTNPTKGTAPLIAKNAVLDDSFQFGDGSIWDRGARGLFWGPAGTLANASIVGVSSDRKVQIDGTYGNLTNGWSQTWGAFNLTEGGFEALLGRELTSHEWEALYRYKSLGFDTGGYTGSWGPEGRMAMLHQKEIVLNAQDTENFLAAIKIVRSMADQIETSALAARYGLTAYQPTTIKPQSDVLEQNVTIHAEFPNATDHNEIEEAFRNLNNLASQYANRK